MAQSANPVHRRHVDDHRHDVPVPRGAIIAVGMMLAVSVALVGLSQMTGLGQSSSIEVEAQHRFALVFADAEDGAIDVRDPADGGLVHRFDGEGQIGFVRVALRALVFDRQTDGIGQDTPFHLLTTESGEAYLTDPATGQFVALNAFGGDNGNQFTALIEAAERSGLALPGGSITLKGGQT